MAGPSNVSHSQGIRNVASVMDTQSLMHLLSHLYGQALLAGSTSRPIPNVQSSHRMMPSNLPEGFAPISPASSPPRATPTRSTPVVRDWRQATQVSLPPKLSPVPEKEEIDQTEEDISQLQIDWQEESAAALQVMAMDSLPSLDDVDLAAEIAIVEEEGKKMLSETFGTELEELPNCFHLPKSSSSFANTGQSKKNSRKILEIIAATLTAWSKQAKALFHLFV